MIDKDETDDHPKVYDSAGGSLNFSCCCRANTLALLQDKKIQFTAFNSSAPRLALYRNASARLRPHSCWRLVCAPLTTPWPMHSGDVWSMFGPAYFWFLNFGG